MRKRSIALTGVLLATLLFVGYSTLGAKEKDPLNYQLTELRSEPTTNSKLIFTFPLKLVILNISPDLDWYKIRLNFDFGPLHYAYEGWAKIPLEKLLKEKYDAP